VRSISPIVLIVVMFCMPGILPVGMAPRPPVGIESIVILSWTDLAEWSRISSLYVNCCQSLNGENGR
jgi:hypothetical protein